MTSPTQTEVPASEETLYLSDLLGAAVRDGSGAAIGRVRDVNARLRGDDYPLVTGLVLTIGSESSFQPIGDVLQLASTQVIVRSPRLDVRAFERRPGEVLLSGDLLGYRVIDVENADFVRAGDVRLRHASDGWVVAGLDVQKRRWPFRSDRSRRSARDWKAFEALIGHAPTLLFRSSFGRIRRLRPADIADLLESATAPEQTELLAQVHDDPELEADVFEELDDDRQAELLKHRSVEEVAGVLARMRADDAADAIADLPQERRQPVLDLLPPGQRTKILTLLGYNEATAGGLMTLEFLALPEDTTVAAAITAISAARGQQPEALTTIYTIDPAGRLRGALPLVEALQRDGSAALRNVANPDPIHAVPADDIVGITTRMADFNLLTLPVIDEQERILGVITVDDALEAAIPEDWRRRIRQNHPATHSIPTIPIEPTDSDR